MLYQFPNVTINGHSASVNPNALAMDTNGVLYGTNRNGGNTSGVCGPPLAGCGLVYSLTPPAAPGAHWIETTIYAFQGGADGSSPAAGLFVGPGGILYGTSQSKGGSGLGTVFAFTPPATPGGLWAGSTLHTFTGVPDGGAPAGILTMDANGVLYGTTNYGGTANLGAVFSLTPPPHPAGAWTETIIWSFSGGANGSVPNGGVLLGPDGVLYGSVKYGGAFNGGAVYALTPPAAPGGAWTQSILHSFPIQQTTGPFPGPLTWGNNGVLYGTTGKGGATQQGNIFALTPQATPGTWNYLNIYSLSDASGDFPAVSYYTGSEVLAAGPGGVLYGTAEHGGGTSNNGTVFSVHP